MHRFPFKESCEVEVEEITIEDVEKAVRNLKNNKVPGTDGMQSELIKYGGYRLLNRIYELVRQIWEEERIPAEWKETIIVPIHKRGDRDKCENYRGIALGNAAYKIFWNIMLEKMKPYTVESRSIVSTSIVFPHVLFAIFGPELSSI